MPRPIRPHILTGTDELAKLLLESTVFVDKSLLVQEFLEDTSDVVLLTRPRRWGKSLNMDMLARFLAVEVDAAGQPLPEGERLHRKLFVGGRVSLGQGTARQLKPLQIAARTDLVAAHLGRYPVISLGLKNIKKVASYAAFLRAIRSPIACIAPMAISCATRRRRMLRSARQTKPSCGAISPMRWARKT